MRTAILTLTALALGGRRLNLSADALYTLWGQVFKDAAHLYVGFLVGLRAAGWKGGPLWLAVGLSALELASFIGGRGGQ